MCGAVAAYLALWVLIPKATFLAAAVRAIDTALPFADGGVSVFLKLAALLVILTPVACVMAAQVGIVYFFAKVRMNFWQALGVLAVCLACAVALGAAVVGSFAAGHPQVIEKLGHYPTFREHIYLLGAYYGPLRIPISLFVMLGAASIGYMVSLRIRDKNLILPVVMFAAYVDLWTVTRGPVSMIMEKAPDVVGAVSAPIPQAGTGAFMPVSMVGPGDFLFLTLVFAAVHRLGMNGARNYWFVFAAMALGMAGVLAGLVTVLPALIVLAIAVVAANWREFRLSREEKISTAAVAAVLLVSLPVVWSVFKPQPRDTTHPKPKTAVHSPARNDPSRP